MEKMTYDDLKYLRNNNKAWKLLNANQAPFIISFLYFSFIKNNRREIPEEELARKLEEYIEETEFKDFSKEEIEQKNPYKAMLNKWADKDMEYLKKFYPNRSDESHYDLTVTTQKAIEWILSFERKSFIGTESRLRTVLNLLNEIMEKSEEDPEYRIRELEKQRENIDKEIENIKNGNIKVLSSTEIKERFQHASEESKRILSDFREVEEYLRELYLKYTEKFITWDKGKGKLLEEYFDEEYDIENSDQGRSFNSFCNFLNSQDEEEFRLLLDKLLKMKEIQEISDSLNMKNIQREWIKGTEPVISVLRMLSKQLRQYITDSYILEETRIKELMKEIESKALELKDVNTKDFSMELDKSYPDISLPMNRKMYRVKKIIQLEAVPLEYGEASEDLSALFEQNYVDKKELRNRINELLKNEKIISLKKIVETYPLELGLQELLTYVGMADETIYDQEEEFVLNLAQEKSSYIRLPLIIFKRK